MFSCNNIKNNILFCYKGDKNTGNESEKKQHFLQHKLKRGSSNEAYKEHRKKSRVLYAAVFTVPTRRGALPEEASIYTTEMTAIKGIKEREDIRWVIYADSLSSMVAIDNNRENHPILTKLQNQGKQLTLCKVLVHIGVKGNVKQTKQQNRQ